MGRGLGSGVWVQGEGLEADALRTDREDAVVGES